MCVKCKEESVIKIIDKKIYKVCNNCCEKTTVESLTAEEIDAFVDSLPLFQKSNKECTIPLIFKMISDVKKHSSVSVLTVPDFTLNMFLEEGMCDYGMIYKVDAYKMVVSEAGEIIMRDIAEVWTCYDTSI